MVLTFVLLSIYFYRFCSFAFDKCGISSPKRHVFIALLSMPKYFPNLSLTDQIFGHRVNPPAGVDENNFKSGDVDSENGGLSLYNVKKRQTAHHQLKNNDHHHVK